MQRRTKMQLTRWHSIAAMVATAAAIGGAVGCGGSSSSTSSGASASNAAAEAKATAGGDIPDNQVFLTYGNTAGGYSLKYPEGWTRKVNGGSTTFTDKDNSISASVIAGPPATTASVSSQLATLQKANPTLKAGK